ncbi:MAG: 3'-5' exonuclease, partial [Chthoniobacterales bacterium]
INTPARGISATTVERALHESVQKKTSLWAALQSKEFLELASTRTATSIKAFVELIGGYETKITQPLSDAASLVSQLVVEVGYDEELRRTCKSGEEADARAGNIRDIIRDLGDFTKRSNKGLLGFLDEVTLDQEREEEKEDDIEKKRGVTLITMHAAKGLEFRHVYLIGLEEGLLPHDRSKSEGSIDEERRLLYVGITRARRTLTLTHCRDRMKYGSASSCAPSSFIKELAPEFVERVNLQKLLSTPVAMDTGKSRFAQMRAALGS